MADNLPVLLRYSSRYIRKLILMLPLGVIPDSLLAAVALE